MAIASLLTGLFLLHSEWRIFVNTLLDGADQQSVLVAFTNDTSDLANSILTDSALLQQHSFEVQNFAIKSILNFVPETMVETLHADMLLVLMGNENNFITQLNNWLELYCSMHINPIVKIVFLIMDKVNHVDIKKTIIDMHNRNHWYNTVFVHLSKLDTIVVKRKTMLENRIEIVPHNDVRFAVPGALFDTLFVKSFENFNQRPFYVYSEPDVPNVAFATTKHIENFVFGSDVSTAIMIGRHLNASVRWMTGKERRSEYRGLNKDEMKAFKIFLRPTYKMEDGFDEVLPWIYNSHKEEHSFMMLMSDHEERNYFYKPLKLNSHTTRDFVVIAPYLGSSSTSLSAILYDSPLFTVWCAFLVYFVVVRLLIRYFLSTEINANELIYIPINTVGLTFGTTSTPANRNRSESMVIVFIAVSSIFTGIFCSGILLQSFVVSSSRPTINSLNDAADFDLKCMCNMFVPIYELPEYSKSMKGVWVTPHRQLRQIFMADRKYVYIYVAATQAKRILSLPHLTTNGFPKFIQLPTPKISEHHFIILEFWPARERLNTLIRRLVEMGLIHEFQRRAKRRLIGLSERRETRVFSEPQMTYESVKLTELYFIFIIGASGLLLSFIVFVVEIIIRQHTAIKRCSFRIMNYFKHKCLRGFRRLSIKLQA